MKTAVIDSQTLKRIERLIEEEMIRVNEEMNVRGILNSTIAMRALIDQTIPLLEVETKKLLDEYYNKSNLSSIELFLKEHRERLEKAFEAKKIERYNYDKILSTRIEELTVQLRQYRLMTVKRVFKEWIFFLAPVIISLLALVVSIVSLSLKGPEQ